MYFEKNILLGLPLLHNHVKSLSGMNSGARSHADRVLKIHRMLHHVDIGLEIRIKIKVKSTKNHCQSNRGLQSSELITNALTCASTKGQVSKIRRNLIGVQIVNALHNNLCLYSPIHISNIKGRDGRCRSLKRCCLCLCCCCCFLLHPQPPLLFLSRVQIL